MRITADQHLLSRLKRCRPWLWHDICASRSVIGLNADRPKPAAYPEENATILKKATHRPLLRSFVCPVIAFLLVASSVAARAKLVTMGISSNGGATVIFDDVTARIYNFGVTQTGVESGFSISGFHGDLGGRQLESALCVVQRSDRNSYP
ncbi:MAG: hypothetical protein WCO90_12320, partial [Planctomycetota bacterium]